MNLSSKEKSRQAGCAGACPTRSQHFTYRRLRSVPGLQHSSGGVSIFIVLRKMKVLELAESACPGDERHDFFSFNRRFTDFLVHVSSERPILCTHLVLPSPFPHWEPLCREHGLGVLLCGNSRPRSLDTQKVVAINLPSEQINLADLEKIFRNMLM